MNANDEARFVIINPNCRTATMTHFTVDGLRSLVHGNGQKTDGFIDLLNDPIENPESNFIIGRFLGYHESGAFIINPMIPVDLVTFLKNNG